MDAVVDPESGERGGIWPFTLKFTVNFKDVFQIPHEMQSFF
jgi:hypothetical protein